MKAKLGPTLLRKICRSGAASARSTLRRHDAGTAYVAVDRHQNDDLQPYIYKTSDYGQTWTKLTNGIPDGSFVRAVREDPKNVACCMRARRTASMFRLTMARDWRVAQIESADHSDSRPRR